jgi:hypothetical protein
LEKGLLENGREAVLSGVVWGEVQIRVKKGTMHPEGLIS